MDGRGVHDSSFPRNELAVEVAVKDQTTPSVNMDLEKGQLFKPNGASA